eukprot:g12799.t2
MWLASPLSYLCSAAATPSPYPSVSIVRQLSSCVPRAFAANGATTCAGISSSSRRSSSRGSRRLVVAVTSVRGNRRHLCSGAGGRRGLFTASCASGDGGATAAAAMVPDDASSLLRAVYDAKPTPQVCLTTTGSGGQALSWVLGVPGASACLLEATVPYSTKACDEKMAAGPPAPGYCSREAAEGLARDAYARAVSLCVAGSPAQGPHVLSDRRVIGVGCTAAVVSSRPRRGLHHCFVCAQTADGLAHYVLDLDKGRRDRFGEDTAVSKVIVQAIAEAAGVPVPTAFKSGHLFSGGGGLLRPSPHRGTGEEGGDLDGAGGTTGVGTSGETVEAAPTAKIAPEPDAIEEIVTGRCGAVLVVPRDTRKVAEATAETEAAAEAAAAVVLRGDALVRAALPQGATVVLPGSYNPLHRGHLGLLEAARRAKMKELESRRKDPAREEAGEAGSSPISYSASATAVMRGDGNDGGGGVAVHGVLEVSVANVDKGGLKAGEVRRRVEQFSEPGGVGWPHPVVVTRAPLFSQKARLFPGCAFVVGADTAKRIIDPRYYGNSQAEMVSALAEIRHLGCSFIVGGREDAGGRFLTLEGVLEKSGLPESLRGMFLGLDESAFREDLSSTSIRAGAASAGL